MSEEDRWEIERLDGIFVGMLDRDELALFERACDAGIAAWSYEGAGGFMGLAKVRCCRTNAPETTS